MIRCNNCGHVNPNYSIFCQSCNTLLSSINSDGEFSTEEDTQPKTPVINTKPVSEPVSKESPAPETPVNYNANPNIPREIYSPDSGSYTYRGPAN